MKKRNFESFCNEVKRRTALVTNKEVTINVVTKSNGTKYTGLVILANGDDEFCISPSIALEPYYDEYMRHKPIGIIVKELIAFYESIEIPEMPEVNILTSRAFASDRIIMQLVNAKWNKELLQDVPHRLWNDLAIVYRVFVGRNDGMTETFLLHNNHLSAYSFTEEELYELAMKNTRGILQPKVASMTDAMREMMEREGIDTEVIEKAIETMATAPHMMYIITNELSANGAATILYTDILEQLAEKIGDDLFIIPSSVHECLAVSASVVPIEEVKEMVYTTNRNEVRRDEWLSDNIYFFDRKTKEIKMM